MIVPFCRYLSDGILKKHRSPNGLRCYVTYVTAPRVIIQKEIGRVKIFLWIFQGRLCHLPDKRPFLFLLLLRRFFHHICSLSPSHRCDFFVQVQHPPCHRGRVKRKFFGQDAARWSASGPAWSSGRRRGKFRDADGGL